MRYGISSTWILHIRIISLLFLIFIKSNNAEGGYTEVQRYDGWYNNRAHPEWGAIETRLIRKTPYAYSDGVYMTAGENRPSPRKISELVMKGVDGLGSVKNRTVMMALFGQVVSFEILLSSVPGCPIERLNIQIDDSDSGYLGPLEMPVRRIKYDPETGQSPNSPREQLNIVTSWIDGSFIYNTKEAWLFAMRTFENGTLKIDENSNLPPFANDHVSLTHHNQPHDAKSDNLDNLFLIGEPRSSQHAASLTFSILFYRYHNYCAKEIKKAHSDWNDEEIFQKARRQVISTLQNIIMYEYMPSFLDEEVEKYTGYKPDVHPGISSVFQSSAFRFGHTTVPPGLYKRNGECHFSKSQNGFAAMRLCSNWWRVEDEILAGGIEPFLMGMASQIAEKEDAILVSDLRDKLYGPLDFSYRDLAAVNIMRGRDMGITDYNTARRHFRLSRIKEWKEINPTLHKEAPNFFQELKDLYNNSLENLDLYVGGMLETENGAPGSLFKAIIQDQFQRIRDGDRFWFENTENGIHTDEEILEIKKITLHDVILKATNIKPHQIQNNIFFWTNGDPCPQPEQLNSSILEQCENFERYDYFRGNEMPYIYVCLLLGSVPLFCAFAAYLTIHFQNKRWRKVKIQSDPLYSSNNNNLKSHHKIYAKEWLHEHHKRAVKIKFGPEEAFYIVNRKGEQLREINVKNLNVVMAEETEDDSIHDPMVWIHELKDHDLVLQFDSLHIRKKFMSKLQKFLSECSTEFLIVPTHYDNIFELAETKERRQRRLEQFFREAYAQAFGIGNKRRPTLGDKDAALIMGTSLTKSEFAEALGMRQDSLFIEQMFACVDKDQDGRLSFQEFLDTVVLFSEGSIEQKLFIIFEMCDKERTGFVDKNEFCNMLRSLVDIANTNLKNDEADELIRGLLDDAGLSNKSILTKEDFILLLKDCKKDLVAIGLDCKGVKQNFLNTKTSGARSNNFNVDIITFEEDRGWFHQKWDSLSTFLENNRQQIFYLVVFYTITLGLAVERFIHYTYLSEHIDLRTVMGYGIGITRGSAAALSFAFSLMLLTMCRNMITSLRDTVVNQYFPLDWLVELHKIIGFTGLFFAVTHTVGHLFNFYQVATQPMDHLECLFKELTFAPNARPNFTYWMFQTITGLTGVMLVIILSIIFVFSCPQIRKRCFGAFWFTHKLYILFYILCILHGLPRLLDAPRFWYFFLGPCTLYIFDNIIGLRQKHRHLEVLDAELLPSDVTCINFTRPPNFNYRSGQWVRVACTAFKPDDYHSFTLTSAPHEGTLTIYVKAQGPWTWKLRNTFDPNNLGDSVYPKLRIEGPYGGGNQEWYRYEVAVMIGGGIGVTPYASILNDLMFGQSTNTYSGVMCQKVYFLWICPTHRHFEWFIDVLRNVENKDATNILEMHIFITQFFHKFDLRTTILYICENHFQRISKRSMFTGLKAVNHFGRPDIPSFLQYVQQRHPEVKKVGVLSCGPPSLTSSVGKGCDIINKRRQLPYFSHHFENF